MKRTRLISAAFGTALLAGAMSQVSGSVTGEDFHLKSTEDLYQVCSVAADASDFVPATYECRGFIKGAVGYHDAVTAKEHLSRLICYTETATVEEGRQAFVAWARANAGNKELMQEQPVVGLVRALKAKYPCSK
jgi:hypothetical protein